MKLTETEIRRMSNFSDKGLLRYIQGENPKLKLDEVIEKTKPLAVVARMNGEILKAEKFEDLIESITSIKANAQ